MNRLGKFILLCSLAFLNSCNKIPMVMDLSVSAQDAGDATVVISGCDQKPRDGYLFCRMKEGSASTGIVKLYFPQTECKRESCISFQWLKKDGSMGYGEGVPKNNYIWSFPLSNIIGSDIVTADDNAEYTVLSKIWFLDDQGEEHVMFSRALLRLLVLEKKYESLKCNDPETGWILPMGKNCRAEVSTGYRVALCGRDAD